MNEEEKKMFKKIWKKYINHIKNSVIPKPYSHSVKMNVEIKKGKKEGTALIPCTIYAMDHSIDLNPSLIRKKDKRLIKNFKPGEKIKYNTKKYDVLLTKNEINKGYILRELERCDKCGQKVVISELKQTRYRSCPSIKIKLGDKSKENVIVPVNFGVNKSDITSSYWVTPLLILISLYGSLLILFPTTFSLNNIHYASVSISSLTVKIIQYSIIGVVLAFLWLYVIPKKIYGFWALHKWYKHIKPTLKKNKYPI